MVERPADFSGALVGVRRKVSVRKALANPRRVDGWERAAAIRPCSESVKDGAGGIKFRYAPLIFKTLHADEMLRLCRVKLV